MKRAFAGMSISGVALISLVLGIGPYVGASSHLAPGPPSLPQILEDVSKTKHNLSSVPPTEILSSGLPGTSREVFSPETTEICVFCHTPHGASSEATTLRAPLWNRNLSPSGYQLYDQVWSRSFEGQLNNPGAPTGYSRLCLSCHDGTIALGSLRNAPGSGGFDFSLGIEYEGTIPPFPFGTIPEGSGAATGNTRRLGTDLKNDHPVSFVYDDALAAVDKELVYPGQPSPSGKVGQEPLYPSGIGPMRRYPGADLSRVDSVQCTSCHNPHQVNYPKFLRANWLHNAPDNAGEQILCLFCHEKPGWIESTHAITSAKRSKYPWVNNDQNHPASGYDFDGDHTVAQYACRNCHDPHTAQGAKRLHRGGVDTPGGLDAIENTCYLCHAPNLQAIPLFFAPAGDPTSGANPRFETGRPAPDIYTQFAKDRSLGGQGSAMNLRLAQGHEPVFTSFPREGVELNSPFAPPFNKFEAGAPGGMAPSPDTSPDPRHIECVDCHNPHQVVKENRLKGMRGITFNGLVVGHDSDETGCMPGPCNREPFVYEVCFRCHGNSVRNIFAGDLVEDTAFNYRSNPLVPASNPSLSMKGFSNKRMEFATYGTAAQEISAVMDPQRGSYVDGTVWGTPDFTTGLRRVGPGVHKAFHPVAAPGRNATPALCKQLSRAFGLTGCDTGPNALPSAATSLMHLSTLTIQCTDCHNNDYYDAYQGTSTLGDPDLLGPMTESNLRSTDKRPNASGISNEAIYDTERSAEPIGPHGSNQIRILRAKYNTDIANPGRNFVQDGFSASHYNNFLLCFQCHDRRAFDPGAGADPNDWSWTNFFGSPTPTDDPGLSRVVTLSWESNLHMYHLMRTGAYCHECHYNVHSNTQASNTIYGDGTGYVVDRNLCTTSGQNCVGLPPDLEDGVADGVSSTHLLNFAPPGPSQYSGEARCDQSQAIPGADLACPPFTFTGADPNPTGFKDNIFEGVEGVTADRPVWYYDASMLVQASPGPARFRCNLRCHGVVMATCFYITRSDPNFSTSLDVAMNTSAGWCAGGVQQVAPIQFGGLSPEIKDLVSHHDHGDQALDVLPEVMRKYIGRFEGRVSDGQGATGSSVVSDGRG